MDGEHCEECLLVEEKVGDHDMLSWVLDTVKNICVLYLEKKAGGWLFLWTVLFVLGPLERLDIVTSTQSIWERGGAGSVLLHMGE